MRVGSLRMEEIKTQQVEFITETIKTILDTMGINYSLEFQEGEDAWFMVKTPDAFLLVGDGGRHLAALNTVVKRIHEKKFSSPGDGPIKFLLDVNDYNKRRIEEIKDAARMHAQRVRYFKKEIEMKPMTAYDRRIVHSVLQEYPDISTESTGEGMERRVVIKPLI